MWYCALKTTTRVTIRVDGDVTSELTFSNLHHLFQIREVNDVPESLLYRFYIQVFHELLARDREPNNNSWKT